MFYPVHFIDNADWLCIDREDYTMTKCMERYVEDKKRYAKGAGTIWTRNS